MDSNFDIYEGKSFKDLCKDICSNQENRKEQIEIFIGDLRPMIKNINDAMVVVPLIKGYIEAGISNDEHLVKLAQICQRIMSAQSSTEENGGSFSLSEDEKKELMNQINEINKSDVLVVKNI